MFGSVVFRNNSDVVVAVLWHGACDLAEVTWRVWSHRGQVLCERCLDESRESALTYSCQRETPGGFVFPGREHDAVKTLMAATVLGQNETKEDNSRLLSLLFYRLCVCVCVCFLNLVRER